MNSKIDFGTIWTHHVKTSEIPLSILSVIITFLSVHRHTEGFIILIIKSTQTNGNTNTKGIGVGDSISKSIRKLITTRNQIQLLNEKQSKCWWLIAVAYHAHKLCDKKDRSRDMTSYHGWWCRVVVAEKCGSRTKNRSVTKNLNTLKKDKACNNGGGFAEGSTASNPTWILRKVLNTLEYSGKCAKDEGRYLV